MPEQARDSLCADQLLQDRMEKLGAVICCMLDDNQYRDYHVENLARWTRQAIWQQQIEVVYDKDGSPLGYFCWAQLDAATARQFTTNRNYVLHSSEWNEGPLLWLMDICCVKGAFPYVRQQIRKRLGHYSEIYWESRRRQVRRHARLMIRPHRCQFFDWEA